MAASDNSGTLPTGPDNTDIAREPVQFRKLAGLQSYESAAKVSKPITRRQRGPRPGFPDGERFADFLQNNEKLVAQRFDMVPKKSVNEPPPTSGLDFSNIVSEEKSTKMQK